MFRPRERNLATAIQALHTLTKNETDQALVINNCQNCQELSPDKDQRM